MWLMWRKIAAFRPETLLSTRQWNLAACSQTWCSLQGTSVVGEKQCVVRFPPWLPILERSFRRLGEFFLLKFDRCIVKCTAIKYQAQLCLQDHCRFLSPKEMMNSHVMPTTRQQAALSGTPRLCLKSASHPNRVKMCGNAMNLPCVGSVILACILGLEKIQWFLAGP